MIKIQSLTKKFGKIDALNNINLTIEPNKIYGLLGRNGAGKTTLLNLMTNKIFPTEGLVEIDGENVLENDRVLNKVFYMFEQDLYPEHLRVKELFKWTKLFYPTLDIEYAYELSKKFELDINKKMKELSTGYRSIVKDILALSSQAEYILLDEPVLGLDANHRDLLYKELLANYIEHPKTILISTHLIEEVAEVLENVIIINEGKIILEDTVENLLTSAYTISGEKEKVNQFMTNKNYIGEETMGRYKKVTILEKEKDQKQINALDLDVSKAELQKLFISLTNK